jgi:IEC3 subunit of the Ino80 complex, chromatin re-modelling
VNDSAQIPADKRIDLITEAPSLSAIPPLISADELSEASQVSTANSQAIYGEIRAMMDEKALQKVTSEPSKSLALLMSVTPHLSASNHSSLAPAVRENVETLEGYPGPISYLTAEQVDDYLNEVDASLGSAPPPHTQTSSHHEVALRNPHSVYNWLRRNEPKIFLQDGEGSEKSMGKPGSLRGAGKRASMPGPSKPDALEIVEEDGMRYDPTISGLEPAKGKRKREDDGGYHPKSGVPGEGKVKKARPRKKKTDSNEPSSAPTSSRKSKAKARHSSPSGEAASNASHPA